MSYIKIGQKNAVRGGKFPPRTAVASSLQNAGQLVYGRRRVPRVAFGPECI